MFYILGDSNLRDFVSSKQFLEIHHTVFTYHTDPQNRYFPKNDTTFSEQSAQVTSVIMELETKFSIKNDHFLFSKYKGEHVMRFHSTMIVSIEEF